MIAPNFFNYDIEIKEKFEAAGANITLYDDRPSNNSIIKAIIRINRNLIRPFIDNHYKQIIKNCGNQKFDIIFFLKGESITINALTYLKNKYPNAKFVLYLWDSIENNKNPKIFNYFDRILSFDAVDCSNNKEFIFRPLFYLDYFKKIGRSEAIDFEYDISFIGTVHSDRYYNLKKILKAVHSENLKMKIIPYLPSKLLFWFRKITERKFRKAPYSEIEFTPMSFSYVSEISKKSRVIIDLPHPKQVGLTMRSIEAIGAKKKLITTNESIKEYDFYNPQNIYILDLKSSSIPLDFLKSKYIDIPDDIYKKYSINSWIDDCFMEL